MADEPEWKELSLWQRMAKCHDHFEKRHPLTVKVWDIAERSGDPIREDRKTYQTICDELGGPEGRLVATHVLKWMQTENPFHVDAAVLLCRQYSFPITPKLQAEIARAAELRLFGQIKPQRTARKVVAEGRKDAALMTMANLIFNGLDIKEAASKVAAAGAGYKASALQKFYEGRFLPRLQAELFETWREMPDAHSAAWGAVIGAMPDTPKWRRGRRR